MMNERMKKSVSLLFVSMVLVLTACSSTLQEANCQDGMEVEVMTTEDGVEFVRTPDACFENLPDWPYEPQYVEIDGLRQAYVDRDLYSVEWPQIHPSAVIHESVSVPADAVVGPGAVLGRNVQIGKRAVVMANAVIEENALIGDETVIHPNVVIGYNCEIGKRCIIKSGCVIGMEGFGFAQDEKRKSHRIPQLGKVVIDDDVVLGANNTVDRATYDETRIRSGVKTDTLCHIAHNTEIDEDVIIVAQTGIAGSCYIGKRVLISGQAAISDHVRIADDVVLVQRAGVISDVEKPGMYAGHPLQPVRQYFKNSALLTKLTDMKKQISKLEKTLQNTDS